MNKLVDSDLLLISVFAWSFQNACKAYKLTAFCLYYLQDVEVMLTGYSTPDALRILHNELSDQLRRHQFKQRSRLSIVDRLQHSFLHHSLAYSAFHWTSAALILISALLLLIAYGLQNHRYDSFSHS